ncbi:SLOG family protein [Sorangium sp. So ce693]|uniref:SLOG family protein n=1 Tax=Sorangium sp. So ce693 TaxID=3133318 RepID=UPI003F632581
MTRVIVAGAVAWTDVGAIRRELAKLPVGATVIHGDSPGADALAGRVAAELGLAVEPMAKNEADYAKYKRGAWKGLNKRMLASGVVRVLVFHPAIEKSRGSGHLVELANAAGVAVSVFAE